MAKAPKKTGELVDKAISTLEDYPPGLLPDGKLNIVQADDPPYEPEIIDADGDELEPAEGTQEDDET